jgi:hypothetical protein
MTLGVNLILLVELVLVIHLAHMEDATFARMIKIVIYVSMALHFKALHTRF